MAHVSGVTEGIGWTKVQILGRSVRIPRGASQFVALHEEGLWTVVRADTLEPCPSVFERNWYGAYPQLAGALREALERQEAWTDLAIGMLGRAVAAEGGPPTRFELDAWQKRRESPRRASRPVPSLPPPALDRMKPDEPAGQEEPDP